MKKCERCNTFYEDAVNFCPVCGERLVEVLVEQPDPTQAVRAAKEKKGQKFSDIFTKEELLYWQGRRNRKAYILFQVLTNIVVMFCSAVMEKLTSLESAGIMFLIILCLGYLQCVNEAKRGHDVNLPTAVPFVLYVATLISMMMNFEMSLRVLLFVSVAYGLYLMFAKGTAGPNQYGEDPLH